ncbi:MAG: glycosyltransferase [Aulosira sp. ZfuVER01]|nr:glycosyltransferase [Aulosira sp. ZfuVER01]MDZ7997746.1 glycosyltransferase [Aulosira sp. DedVER01a]MDZ8052241.1 glycosyltransferase [Aulosira sp. ZfuCHP01]
MLPKVSILIPCYNAERWIAQAIESALNQTYFNKEVIVVDDGSTDRSLEIIKRFGDRIRWETGPNRGGNVARNRLLELSTGEWLQYLDADDYLLTDKIEQQVKYLNSLSEVDIIYSSIIVEYPNSKPPEKIVYSLPEPHDPWILLIKWQLPQTGGCLWRKQAILQVGGWKLDQPCCQEHELYLRCLMHQKKLAYCKQIGAVYRMFGKNTVSTNRITETYRRRLEIIQQAQEYLENTNSLNAAMLTLINQAKFDSARIIWNFDREWAIKIICSLNNRDKNFIPSKTTAPFLYQICYRTLGFAIAERLASAKRYFNIVRFFKKHIVSA